jgi:DegV family protein with EDD domain
MAISEIAHEIRTRVPKVKTAFVIDTLDYLYMGGRCSALQNFISGILKIKPIVKVVEGKMILGEKSRGNRMKAINIMLQHAIEDKECIEMDRVMVTLSEGNNDGPYLKDEIDKSVGPNETLITTAGCVISSHCGPNTIGIL